MLIPDRTAPSLELDTLSHGPFTVPSAVDGAGQLLVFYRGLHCPICIDQLAQIDAKIERFAELGVDVTAISADDADRAARTASAAGVQNLRIAHGLDLATAHRDWGLWISQAREGSDEPEQFSEPAMVTLDRQGMVQFVWVQSSPLARPRIDDVIDAIRFQQENQYPPRGRFTANLQPAA